MLEIDILFLSSLFSNYKCLFVFVLFSVCVEKIDTVVDILIIVRLKLIKNIFAIEVKSFTYFKYFEKAIFN